MLSFAIGVDLGGTNLRIAAIEETGNPLEIYNTTTAVTRGRDCVIQDMCQAIHTLAGRFSRTHRFSGTGVGIPGIIDLESGVLHSAANLPEWKNYPVKAEIQKRLGAPVFLENDANCAALGEKWMGAGRTVDGLCMITLGTGVGGGFIFREKVWHGMIGMAGEIGHMRVSADGPPCGCGGRGCVEQYASATAIRRMANEAIQSGRAPGLAQALGATQELSAKWIFQQAVAGDPAARQNFATARSARGTGRASLIHRLKLSLYVAGGGGSNASSAFSTHLVRGRPRPSAVLP